LLPKRQVLERQLATRAKTASQCPDEDSEPSDHDREIADQSAECKFIAPDDFSEGTGRVDGTFAILKFVQMEDPNQAGHMILGAAGTLTLKTTTGNTLITQAVMPAQATTQADTSAPAAGAVTAQQAIGPCVILNLTLGPLDLNLAGLLVHLDTVHLIISSNPALGLLGQLLTGLLCGGLGSTVLGDLTALITALNNLLSLLGTI
jgi:hypothetical protein